MSTVNIEPQLLRIDIAVADPDDAAAMRPVEGKKLIKLVVDVCLVGISASPGRRSISKYSQLAISGKVGGGSSPDMESRGTSVKAVSV